MNLPPLLLAGESQTLEFKASFDKAAIESLVAFANSQGGTVGKETDYPNVRFSIEETQGGVWAIFTNQDEGVNGGVNGGVNSANDLLSVIHAQSGLNTVALVQLTGKPQRSIERWLQQLKAQGLVEFRGAPKSGGYHAVTENPPNTRGEDKQK